MMVKTKKDATGYNNEPYARLLAAEAEYLQERGWIPHTTGGRGIVWKDPQSESATDQLFRMDVAVTMQRQREPDDVHYDESAAGDGKVAAVLRIYEAAKVHALDKGHHVVFSGKGGRCIECDWKSEEA